MTRTEELLAKVSEETMAEMTAERTKAITEIGLKCMKLGKEMKTEWHGTQKFCDICREKGAPVQQNPTSLIDVKDAGINVLYYGFDGDVFILSDENFEGALDFKLSDAMIDLLREFMKK